MQPSIDIFAILNSAGVAQAIFWAVAVLSIPTGNRVANRLLAILLLAFAAGITLSIFDHTRYILLFPHLAEIAAPLKFLYPPLFFLYVKSLTVKNFSLKKQLQHFFPVIICTLYFLPFYFTGVDEKLDLLNNSYQKTTNVADVLNLFIFIQETAYIILTLRLWRNHSIAIRNCFSTIDKISLEWIRNMIFAFLGVTAIYLFFLISNYGDTANYITGLSLTGFIFFMGFMGLRQPQVFGANEPGASQQKYSKSGLGQEQAEQYLQKTLVLMAFEKPYLDSNLTLKTLADQLSISPNHLSQILNDRRNQSFFDFVNSFRVEEAKQLLKDPQKDRLTILAIAYEAGFASKSSFNTAFKKFTGITPSQFKKQSLAGV